MAKEKLEVIKESDITNNCPECFNQDMKITFYQKHNYSKLFHRITDKVTHQIKCNICDSLIYPVRWTEDIERIFEYNQKMVIPKKASLRLTTLFYVLLLSLIALTGAGAYAYMEGVIQF